MYIPPRKILPHVCSLEQLVNVLFMSVRIDVGFFKNIYKINKTGPLTN